ncbi:MAG: aspartyl/asparaginyl beta-hydroxylase domain-containing protein [Burkholderiales bacterium]|nr:aspartyl/asparaginyl beta-hydroxylase domain-containing protein [Burkholderiales bacterium]
MLPHAQVAELHQRARQALQQQREAEAVAMWQRIVEIAPGDAPAQSGLARWAMRRGDLSAAALHFGLVARAEPGQARHWTALAQVQRQRGDDAAEEAALFEALKADPQDLFALLMRGQLYERQGRDQAAAHAYIAATIVAPPVDRLSPELRPLVTHAIEYRLAYQQRLANHVDAALEASLREESSADTDRFRLSLDIMVGRKRRYDSQPSRYFMPRLEPIEFFDPALFPWMAAIEAGTDAIRDEFLAVLHDDSGFTPYVEYGPDQPIEQWAELNHSLRWSCYHLWRNGQPVPEHVARCPETMHLLEASPRPDQPGRTPVAMFSLLKPRTRIPPHVGVSNARLVCHLPLIIPPRCHFRVGNTTREWVPGRAWVFDDSINHEAVNDSDQLRVILIWDTWHPHVTEAERRLITALSRALNAFGGVDVDYGA